MTTTTNSSSTNPPTWEQCKENAAPLQRGRNVQVLERAFQRCSRHSSNSSSTSTSASSGPSQALGMAVAAGTNGTHSHDDGDKDHHLNHDQSHHHMTIQQWIEHYEQLVKPLEFTNDDDDDNKNNNSKNNHSHHHDHHHHHQQIHEDDHHRNHNNNNHATTAAATISTSTLHSDPLRHWLAYIKFYQDHVPHDTHTSFLLLERCLRAILSQPVWQQQYANDVRFIQVALQYADQTDTPQQVFQYLYQNKIGRHVALFWMAWAWISEHQGQYPMADQVLKRGIQQYQAQPLVLLERRYQQFLRRMTRQYLTTSRDHHNNNNNNNINSSSTASEEQDDDDHDDEQNNHENHQNHTNHRHGYHHHHRQQQQPRRQALGSLEEEQFRRNDRRPTTSRSNTTITARSRHPSSLILPSSSATNHSMTFFNRSQPPERFNNHQPLLTQNATNSSSFAIFTESNDENHYNHLFQDNDPQSLPSSQQHHHHHYARDSYPILDTMANRRKENTQNPERWNQRPGGFTSQYPVLVPETSTSNSNHHHHDHSHVSHRYHNPSLQPFATSMTAAAAASGASAIPRPTLEIHMDEECAMQHEQQNKTEQLQQQQQRRDRDERTFQERSDGGMAEKLTKEPLRYVRNPSQLDTDQSEDIPLQRNDHGHPFHRHALPQQPPSSSSSSLLLPPSQILIRASTVLVDNFSCFEEARATQLAYQLVSSETNNMNQIIIMINAHNKITNQHEDSEKNIADEMDIDEDDDVNKLSSPMSATTYMRRVEAEDQQHHQGSLDPASASRPPTHNSNNNNNSLNNSSFVKQLQNSANVVATVIKTTATTTSSMWPKKVLFSANHHQHLNNTSHDSQRSAGSSAANTTTSKSFEDVTINTKFAVKELSAMFASPAVMGFQDNAADHDDDDDNDTRLARQRPEHAISIMIADNHDGTNGDENHNIDASVDSHGVATTEQDSSFSVVAAHLKFDDDDNNNNNTGQRNVQLDWNKHHNHNHSLLAESTRDVGNGKQSSIASSSRRQYANRDPVSKPPDSLNPNGFVIFCDDDDDDDEDQNNNHHETDDCQPMDTSYSHVKPSGMTLAKQNQQPLLSQYQHPATITATNNDNLHDITMGERGSHPMEMIVVDEVTGFGDISRIAEAASPSVVLNIRMTTTATDGKIEYTTIHNLDIQRALVNLQQQGENVSPRIMNKDKHNNLLAMLSTTGFVCHLPHLTLPRALMQSKPLTKGTEVKLGQCSCVVRGELGRGTYGVVALLGLRVDSPQNQNDNKQAVVAVKIQSPAGSLALEYEILQKIESRVSHHHVDPYPFPRSISFVALADGGLLGMTAASDTGLNLVDLTNIYQIQERAPLPELVALHYTARMLKHMEVLHREGKILHCDAKPDNWVLTSSSSAYSPCHDVVPASDLMLVDFGRAVDLTTLASSNHLMHGSGNHDHNMMKQNMSGDNVVLYGNAVGDHDMACVAMRQGEGWLYDVDTFGICASAHVLLFSTHLEIMQDERTKRWCLCKPLRRYWQRDLWHDLFDALLNYNGIVMATKYSYTTASIDVSSPWEDEYWSMVRSCRHRIETYLQSRGKDLDVMLKQQARRLPTKRIT